MKFKVTITFTYEAPKDGYPEGSTPEECAEIDKENLGYADPTALLEICEDYKIKIEPLEEE